jgi:PAS domain-containing protein
MKRVKIFKCLRPTNRQIGHDVIAPARMTSSTISGKEVSAGVLVPGSFSKRDRPPDLADKLSEILAKLHQGGNVLSEFQNVTKDGQKIPVEVNAVVFQLHGRPHVLSIIRNITERKRAEEEKAKLEAKLVQA